MLKTIWLKTIRDNWRAAVAWGIGLGALIYVGVIAYQLAYPTAALRQQAMGEIGPLLNSFRFLIGDPVDISTPGGFVTFRYLGFIPVALGIWAILATTSTRGEEQRGIGDLLLTTPHRRSNILTQQWLGFSLALLSFTLLMWLVATVGWLTTGESLDVTAMLVTSLNIGFQAWFWGSLGLLLAQFFASRGLASGISIGLMVYMFLFNNIAGMFDWLSPFAAISPFHYYSLNRPLAPGWSFDPLAFVITPVLALICFGLALYFVNRRDVGAAFPLFGQRSGKVNTTPINWREPLLGNLFLRYLRDMILPSVWWLLGIVFYVVVIVASAGQVMDAVRSMAKGGGVLSQFIGANFTVQDYIALVLDLLLPIVTAAYAVTQVAGWTADEENGIDDMVLTTPHQRWAVLLNRFVATTAVIIAMLVIIALVTNLSAVIAGLDFDAGKSWLAMAQLLPFTLLVAAVGFALAAWLKRPGTAVILVSIFVVISYVLDLLGQSLKLPDFVPALSIFHAYGTPTRSGLDPSATLGLSLATLVLLAAAIAGFQRRDLSKG